MEDLIDLLYREQEALLLAAHTSSKARRRNHLEQAGAFSVRVSSHPAPYRTPSALGAVRFNPGRFGAGLPPVAKLFNRTAK